MSGGGVIRWGWYSIAVNVFLVTVHGSIAFASGSLAVAAEFVHNIVDLLTAVAVLLGVRLASRKTKAFPYGLYKLENLVAAGLGIMTFVTAYEVARSAVAGTPPPGHAEAWMLGTVVVSGDVEGSVSRHFGEAPYFALVDVGREGGKVEEQRVVANPHRLQERGKGIRVAEWLVSQKIDVALVTEDLHGKGPE